MDEVVSKSRTRKKAKAVGVNTSLVILVVISLFFNGFLVYQINSLTKQNTLLISSINKSSSKSVSAVVANSSTVDTAPIYATLVNDKRCQNCDVTNLLTKLKQVFPTLQLTMLDYNDANGKAFYDSNGLTYLPAVLFDSSIKTSSAYSSVSSYLVQSGNNYNLQIGAQFNPLGTVCYDVKGNVDCTKAGCSQIPDCRAKIPKQLDLFVMSHCPYGIEATQSLKPVLDAIKDVNFSMHFIISYDAGTKAFSSLHGSTEVDDDLREICIQKHYPSNKFMNYVLCLDSNITSGEWQKCALAQGMSVDTISACATGQEGVSLLSADAKFVQTLGVDASPTWMANNYKIFSALAPEDIRAGFCNLNIGVVGCDKIQSTSVPTSSGSCAG
jgi:hypothetical protein